MSRCFFFPGGDDEIRTRDPLLARQVLSQLSYAPMIFFINSIVWYNSYFRTVDRATFNALPLTSFGGSNRTALRPIGYRI